MNFNNFFIISEIGINHDGSFEKAKKLILKAKQNGADAVKFQYFQAGDLYLENSKNFKILKKLTISKKNLELLRIFARKIGIFFFCTPFSFDGINFLKEISVDGLKIASMDNLNHSFIGECCKDKTKVILSTGMLNKKETDTLFKKYKKKVFFLHCVSNYPVKRTDIGINVLDYYNKKLKKRAFGYSDHFEGINAVKIAMLKGAKIIEKHFTLKKRLYMDHGHSMDASELKELNIFRELINNQQTADEFFKKRTDIRNAALFRRGIYANKELNIGDHFNMDNLRYVRPLGYTKYIDLKKILGKKLTTKIKKYEKINKK